jgi:predicted nucleotidyltransferase
VRAMTGAKQIVTTLSAFLAARAEAEGLSAAYLFGSVARGTAGRNSDVDVGLLYSDPAPSGFAGLPGHLEAELSALLGLPVQIVQLNRAPVDLAKRVLRDGQLLLDRDHLRRIEFEIRVRNEFWDLEPYLREYRRMRAVEGPGEG